MPATMQVLKVTPVHAVVMVSGVGSQTIRLAVECATAVEIAGTIGTPIVDIKAIWSNCLTSSGNTIVRNSVTEWTLPNFPFHWQFDGWSDNRDHTSDIVVTLGATGGNIVLELVKKGGYGDSQFKTLQ